MTKSSRENPRGSNFEIRPIAGTFAAEVVGFDVHDELGDAERDRLSRAWAEHVVLCFRNQVLAPAEFLALARIFGAPVRQPIQRAEYRVEGFPELRVLSSDHVDTFGDGKPLLTGGSWHSDHSHLSDPPWGTLLHALTLPSRGGDTLFMNLCAAYAGLSAHDRAECDALVGEHRYLSKYSKRRLQAMTETEKARASSARHALVRPHPVHGRPTLFFNPVRIERFDGMGDAESQALMAKLLAHGESSEYVYRHRWQADDVLIWDNRQALHMVEHDYPADESRVMHRTLVGSPALAAHMASAYPTP